MLPPQRKKMGQAAHARFLRKHKQPDPDCKDKILRMRGQSPGARELPRSLKSTLPILPGARSS